MLANRLKVHHVRFAVCLNALKSTLAWPISGLDFRFAISQLCRQVSPVVLRDGAATRRAVCRRVRWCA